MSETVFNEGSIDVDFRVEGNTATHAFFVEGETDRVGIGTNSPNANSHLHIIQNTSGTGYYGLAVQGDDTTNGARIGLGESDANFSTRANVLDIGFDSSTDFIWSRTGKEMLIGVNNSEKVRIKTSATIFSGDNLVGIGQGTPTNSPLEVNVTQSNGTVGSSGFVHIGSAGNADGYISGISLGYRENNASYRKVAIATKSRNDGAARNDLCFLVDTAADTGSANLADAKITIDGFNGTTKIRDGLKFSATNGADPTGDDHYDVPIKMVVYRKTVSSGDVTNGYIDFDTDIYRDNIISGITNHFGSAASNVNNVGYNPGYGLALHFYAGGACRLYFGSSVVANDKMSVVLFITGNTG